MIVRELTGDVYFGKPRGVKKEKTVNAQALTLWLTRKMKSVELPFAPLKLPERVKESPFSR